MYSIYIDVVFFVNFIVDYLLLVITALLGGYPIKRLRFTLASVFGGFYATLVLFPTLNILTFVPLRLLVGWILCLIGFKYDSLNKSLRQFILLMIASACCAGAVCVIYFIATSTLPAINSAPFISVAPNIIIFSALAVYLLLGVILKGYADGKKIITMNVSLGERNISLRTLIDTGNCLKDPITNTPVLVVWKRLALSLFEAGISEFIYENDLTDASCTYVKLPTDGAIFPFRLLSYHTVANRGGMLLAFTAEVSESNGRHNRTVTVALSEYPVSDGSTFDAIIGT